MKITKSRKLNEGLTVDQAISQYTKRGLSEDEIIEVIKSDPTSKYEGGKAGDYTQWILEKILKGEKPTDVLFNNLAVFDKAKKKKNFEGEKNIMAYKTLSQFNDFMSQEKVEDKTGVELTYGIKPIFKGKKYTLYQPKTYEQSCQLRGDDAVWCTGDHRTSSYWNKYYDQGDLIIFYNNSTNKPEYQIYIANGKIVEIEDARNYPEDEEQFFKIVGSDAENFVRNDFVGEQKDLRIYLDEDRDGWGSQKLYLDFGKEQPNNTPSLLFDLIPLSCNNYRVILSEIDEGDQLNIYDGVSPDDIGLNFEDLPYFLRTVEDNNILAPGTLIADQDEEIIIVYDGTVYTIKGGDVGLDIEESEEEYIDNSSIIGIRIPKYEDISAVDDESILRYTNPWWLSTPSGYASYFEEHGVQDTPLFRSYGGNLMFVYTDGSINKDMGVSQEFNKTAYRPILELDDDYFEEGKIVSALGRLWVSLGENKLLLMDDPIVINYINSSTKVPFVYEESWANDYLTKWLSAMSKNESLTEEIEQPKTMDITQQVDAEYERIIKKFPDISDEELEDRLYASISNILSGWHYDNELVDRIIEIIMEDRRNTKMNESKETTKLYQAISDTADAIDDLTSKDEKSAKKNLDKADNNINDVKDTLEESLETGIATLFMDLINQEYNLLTQYESAYVTMEDEGEDKFNEIMDYIEDDINIHIGMLQAAIEDLNPSAEKVDDGKERADQLILDESLFESKSDKKLYAFMTYSSMTDEWTAFMSYDKDKVANTELQKKVINYFSSDDDDKDFEEFVQNLRDDKIIIGTEDYNDYYGQGDPFGHFVLISDLDENDDGGYVNTKNWHAEIGKDIVPIEVVNYWKSRY